MHDLEHDAIKGCEQRIDSNLVMDLYQEQEVSFPCLHTEAYSNPDHIFTSSCSAGHEMVFADAGE